MVACSIPLTRRSREKKATGMTRILDQVNFFRSKSKFLSNKAHFYYSYEHATNI